MSNIKERHIQCPSCPSSDAYCVYEDGHGYCFSCLTYVSPKGEFLDDKYTFEYLPWRGVTKETMRFYDAKTKINSDGKPVSIGYRYPNDAYKVRNLHEKDFRTTGDIGKAGLYGRDKFAAGGKYCILTEGELDAQSYYQALHIPVVSVQSAATAVRDCSLDRDWLNSFGAIYLAFDNDGPGRQAAARVAKLFDYNKVFLVKLLLKDPNEYLQQAREKELVESWKSAKKYRPETILSSLDEFKTILSTTTTKGIPYPFATLTRMTYGIRTSESVLITAQEGVGKTEVCHAILYKILKETDYNVGAIFLEEPKQRLLQAMAGLEIGRPVHLPDSGCTPDQVNAAIERLVQKDDRLCIYSHFGSDDPDILADTIRYLVVVLGCRVVVLDHITMGVSGSAGEDERKQLDYLSTRLEMMVKELDFALIIVSHVNDEGQTRGSRMLGKNADIRVDLKRDLLADDPLARNTTELVVSKNRFCGITGSAGSIIFDPVSYSYKEAANDNFPTAQEKAA